MIEYKPLRTKHSKTFHVDRTTKRLLVSLRPLHYKKDDKWTEIDLRPKQTDKGYVVETPNYRCEVILFPFEIKFNGQSIRQLDSPDTIGVEMNEDGLFFPRIGYQIYFRPNGVEVFKPEKETTWKINGKVVTESNARFPLIEVERRICAETYDDVVSQTKTPILGKVSSWEFKKRETISNDPEDTTLLEIIYGHQAW